jgi:hypothetical protein
MSKLTMRSMVAGTVVTAVGTLLLGGCVVTGRTAVQPTGTITVRPTATVQTTGTVYAQPAPATTTVYAQPAPPPVTGGSVGVGVGGVYAGAGVYAAPPAVGFVPVNPGWMTDGYDQNDYVAYHMTLRARQFAAGYIPITQLFRGQLGQGQRQYVTITAQPGRCYRIIGVGGQGVRDLDLRLLDMNGNVLDQDVATDNFPVLGLQRNLCLNWQGTFRIEVIMYSGGGTFGLQAFATPT